MREPGFLTHPRVPKNVSSAIARVSLPAGGPLDDAGIRRTLAPHEHSAVIELERAEDAFCGFSDAGAHAEFLAESERVLTYERVPFCTMEGSDNAPLYSRCCTPWHEGEKFFPCVLGFGKPKPLPKCGAGA